MKNVTAVRLRMLENGWSPIRNRDKRTFMKDWPNVALTPDEIASWERMTRDRATGCRIENGLLAIDVDVTDADMVEQVADLLMDIVPELDDEATPWLERSSGRAKVAWFFRVDEPFNRLHTRRWTRPGDGPDDDTQFIEMFGGASPRQFGMFGPHTVDERGEVVREYEWRDRSPLNTAVEALPLLSKQQCFALADGAEKLFAAAGWEPVKLSKSGEDAATRVYDLTEDMRFDCNDGVTRTLAELRAAAGEEGLRCSASWLEGPQAKRRERCLVTLTRSGHVAIWETAAGVTHVEISAEPAPMPQPDLDRLAELLREVRDRRRNRLTASDDFQTALTKALGSFAWCPPLNRVVPLWPQSVEDGEPMAGFRVRMAKFGYREVGPRGGRGAFINPCDAWTQHEQLIVVEGVQMRPDRERPVFEEDGRRYVNAYRPVAFRPEDAEGGDAEPGFDFLKRLVPGERERQEVIRWTAHKLRYPHIPMYAMVMVAHGRFGTGRNTYGDLLSLLLGRNYVREIPFETFTGKTYQSQYNAWQADALVVVVSESSEAHDGSLWNTKRNTYERLKQIVDPRPGRPVLINMKGATNFYSTSSASFLIATNHADALPIPENDRRFGVVLNGEPQDPGYWAYLRDWMERPANIAAFHAALMAVDLSEFDPYTPPLFEGKTAMAEESRSDLDRAFGYALEGMAARVATLPQIEAATRAALTDFDLVAPNGDLRPVIRKMAMRELHRVGERFGRNWFIHVDSVRYPVYAQTPQEAAKWTKADRDALSREVWKNGSPSGPGGVGTGFSRR